MSNPDRVGGYYSENSNHNDIFSFMPGFGSPNLALGDGLAAPTADMPHSLNGSARGGRLSSPKSEPLSPGVMYQLILQLNARITALEQHIFSTVHVNMQAQSGQQAISVQTRGQQNPVQKLIKVRELDSCCQDFIKGTFEPSIVELNQFCQRLNHAFPQYPMKVRVSSVRKWLRKKRDELGRHVFAACEEQLHKRFAEGATFESVQEELKAHGGLYNSMMAASRLEIFANENTRAAFLLLKIRAFYDRRILGTGPILRKPGKYALEEDCDTDDDAE